MSKSRNNIVGPVIPLPTPFKENHDVDYDTLFQYITFLVSRGISNIMTTVGTSRFNLLTDEEIKKVNQTVAEAVGDRAISIVANPPMGGTRHAIEFAEHSQKIGADVFLVYFPERYYGEDNTYRFFREVADAVDIEILIHETPKRNGMGSGQRHYSISLLSRLMEIDNIIGIKEEALDPTYSDEIVEYFSDNTVIIGAGGGMSRYLQRDHARGAKAYLGGLGNFVPELEMEFFSAITSGDKQRAEQIVTELEIPYFEKVVPIGWHPCLKAALALKGLMPSFERSPMKQLLESEIAVVREALKTNGWL